MLTLLLNRNLGGRGISGGTSVGAPVVSVGTTATAGGGGARHYGVSYDYDDPVIQATKEELVVLKEKRKEVKRDGGDNGAMLRAIAERIAYLQELLSRKQALLGKADETYRYQQEAKARAEALENQQKAKARKEKRMRRAQAIMKLLN